ncbi:Cytochrome [Forsythia ovata]|uniref:Cytochrome n=1 Tax=Forsythia ovata TaxID=205694 RepID=A0ABD1P4L9_9LAMI
MAKATQELDIVIVREKKVKESEIPNLPYLDAIVKETMRLHLHPVADFTFVKAPNLGSFEREGAVWGEPEEFRPERFLEMEMDVKGKNFELLPFGSGPRMCPGYSLGLKMIWLKKKINIPFQQEENYA